MRTKNRRLHLAWGGHAKDDGGKTPNTNKGGGQVSVNILYSQMFSVTLKYD